LKRIFLERKASISKNLLGRDNEVFMGLTMKDLYSTMMKNISTEGLIMIV